MALGVSLFDAGFEDVDSARIVESFARHFMAHIDAWQRDGFRHVADDYIAHLPHDAAVRRAIDGNGDLLVRPAGKINSVTRPPPPPPHALVPALVAAPEWLDAVSGEPLL